MVEESCHQEKCIVCGSDRRELLFKREPFRAVKCTDCKLVYSLPQNTESLERIYDERYYHSENPHLGYSNYEGYERLLKKTFSLRLAEVEKRVEKGRILDVGCAMGFFLEVAGERGWDAYGVEVSPYAAGYAKSRGLSAFQGELSGVDFPLDFFRAVTIWDLFEGLADPLSTLTSARDFLRADGMLVIGTPNVESLAPRLLGKNWAHFKPSENRFYYSPQTIARMLTKAGFRVIAVSAGEGGQFCDLRFVSQKLKSISPAASRAIGFLSGKYPFSELSFYVNTRDRMVVYALKDNQGEGKP